MKGERNPVSIIGPDGDFTDEAIREITDANQDSRLAKRIQKQKEGEPKRSLN